MTEWISVRERLPEEDGRYLCYREYGHSAGMRILSFAKNLYKVDKIDFSGMRRAGWYYYDSEYGFCEANSVTHWLPLPEPPRTPKERGEKK